VACMTHIWNQNLWKVEPVCVRHTINCADDFKVKAWDNRILELVWEFMKLVGVMTSVELHGIEAMLARDACPYIVSWSQNWNDIITQCANWMAIVMLVKAAQWWNGFTKLANSSTLANVAIGTLLSNDFLLTCLCFSSKSCSLTLFSITTGAVSCNSSLSSTLGTEVAVTTQGELGGPCCQCHNQSNAWMWGGSNGKAWLVVGWMQVECRLYAEKTFRTKFWRI